jgi:UDP-glucuronate decarboxylase
MAGAEKRHVDCSARTRRNNTARSMDDSLLVTGGAGFLGSHLCDRLLERGHQVIALDDLSTGHRRHVQHLAGHPRFRLLVHDLTQALPPAVLNVRRIYNLACPASPAYYQREPVQTTLSSVLGIWRLLDLAQNTGARVLQASTSEVYGDPEVHPQVESYHGLVNPIGPRSCYDEGKRCAEALAFAYHRQRHVPIRVARIFNSYGPRLRPGDGRVVSNFIVQALAGEPLTVYGDGEQTRSFCYVDDTVEGLLRMMDAAVEGPINIGNPSEHTVLELAEKVLRLTRSRSRLVRRPLPADDPQRRRPDIARARHHLGWEPKVALDDGLERTIDYFRRELAEPAAPRALAAN